MNNKLVKATSVDAHLNYKYAGSGLCTLLEKYKEYNTNTAICGHKHIVYRLLLNKVGYKVHSALDTIVLAN
ncbi:hypothetical protein R4Z10_09285 [Niallia sp. XMNu-256]|uniref:hypothetical protein n=1 Tax=Niallia sp. XMNu-256 TaxID=3082444 RepID=UPI0030D54B71